MAWNAVRRAVTVELRLQAAAWLEKRLNDTLPVLQVEFQKTLNDGQLPELLADHEAWVKDSMMTAKKGLKRG